MLSAGSMTFLTRNFSLKLKQIIKLKNQKSSSAICQAATSQELHSWLLLSQTPKPVASPRKLLPLGAKEVIKEAGRRMRSVDRAWILLGALPAHGSRCTLLAGGICAYAGQSPAVSPPMLTHKGVPPGNRNTITH